MQDARLRKNRVLRNLRDGTNSLRFAPADQVQLSRTCGAGAALNDAAVICSRRRLRVSTPKTRIAIAASAIGIPPTNVVPASEGAATPSATSAIINTPPALLAPAANPVPRERMRVG